MTYDEYYNNNKNAFGKEPEKILVEYIHLLNKKKPILDIGAGQGRNTFYLAKLGYSIDAIDTSSVAIESLEKSKEIENLGFQIYNAGYKEFGGSSNYLGILVFGLLQILDREEIDLLKRKLFNWMKEDSVLFITVFTTEDDSHKVISNNSKRIGKNSYIKPNGEKRTFFESGELKSIFNDYKKYTIGKG